MLEIMERYGWDYHTYKAQPTWVVSLARKKMGMQAKIAKHAIENTQHHG